MANLNITTQINIKAQYTSPLDLTTPIDSMDKTYTQALTTGTGADQADRFWHDTRQLAASASEVINLKAVTGAFGAIAFAKIKHLTIYNKSATRTLTVGNAASTTWVGPFGAAAHTIKVQAGETKVIANTGVGYDVTSSAKSLKILNGTASSTACSYDIVIAGTSA